MPWPPVISWLPGNVTPQPLVEATVFGDRSDPISETYQGLMIRWILRLVYPVDPGRMTVGKQYQGLYDMALKLSFNTDHWPTKGTQLRERGRIMPSATAATRLDSSGLAQLPARS